MQKKEEEVARDICILLEAYEIHLTNPSQLRGSTKRVHDLIQIEQIEHNGKDYIQAYEEDQEARLTAQTDRQSTKDTLMDTSCTSSTPNLSEKLPSSTSELQQIGNSNSETSSVESTPKQDYTNYSNIDEKQIQN